MSRLSAILAVAYQEMTRHGSAMRQPKVMGFLLLSGVALAVLVPTAIDQGVHPDRGLFQVAVGPDARLAEAVATSTRFDIRSLEETSDDVQGSAVYRGGIVDRPDAPPLRGSFSAQDVVVLDDRFYYQPTTLTGEAAALELERTTRAWLDSELEDEADQDAAFPVQIDLYYWSRDRIVIEEGDEPAEPDTTTTGGGQQPQEGSAAATNKEQNRNKWGGESVEVVNNLRPNEVEPPFPLRSLLLTFAYIVPLNFVTEVYTGSVISERVRGRGVPLLSAPISSTMVLAGRSLPYVGIVLLLAVATTIWLGAGWLGFLAILPVLGFALSSGLLLSMLARNQRGLTAFLVAANVLLSTFLFLPAVFTRVHPVAFVSPVSVVAASIRGEAVTTFQFLYATLPLTFITIALLRVAVALFREESLMSPAPFLTKLIDGVQWSIKRSWGLLFSGAIMVPFAIALEVILLVFALTLDLVTLFVVFLLGAAFIEEGLKAIPAFAYGTRTAPTRSAMWIGFMVGLGFWLGEKGVLIWSLIGLELLPLGEETLVTFGIAAQLILVFAPLALHSVTTALFLRLARAGTGRRIGAWAAASVLHAGYNATVFALGRMGVFG